MSESEDFSEDWGVVIIFLLGFRCADFFPETVAFTFLKSRLRTRVLLWSFLTGRVLLNCDK